MRSCRREPRRWSGLTVMTAFFRQSSQPLWGCTGESPLPGRSLDPRHREEKRRQGNTTGLLVTQVPGEARR